MSKSKKEKIFTVLFISVILIVPLIIYFFDKFQPNKADNNLKVATTIFPIYDITKNIVQDKIEVIQILPSGASAHSYDPSPKDLKNVQDCGLVFAIGLNLDDWAIDLAGDNAEYITLSTNIDLLNNNDEAGNDPHYWLSPTNAKIMARTILKNLQKYDPENRAFYELNYNKYIKQLDELNIYILQSLNDYRGEGIITFHNAFSYLTKISGIKILTSIEPFAGREPSPQYIKDVENIIKEYNISVLYSEPQLSDKLVKSLQESYNIQILELDPIGGTNNRNSYIDLIKFNTDQIKKGLELQNTNNTN